MQILQTIQDHPDVSILAWLGLLMVIEQMSNVFPLPRPGEGGLARWFANLVFGTINKLGQPLIFLPLLAMTTHLNLWTRPEWMGGFFGFFLDLAVLDMTGYWFHRYSHNNAFLWRFHQIHHLDEALDATTGFRVHWFERIIHNALKLGVIAAFNVSLANYALYETIGAFHALFHHCNLRLPAPVEKVLRLFITTPAFHWVHHHDLQKDTDSNYGFILSWWDGLFGTWNSAERTPEWRMGLDYSRDLGFWGLMFTPFHPVKLKYRAVPPTAPEPVEAG